MITDPRFSPFMLRATPSAQAWLDLPWSLAPQAVAQFPVPPGSAAPAAPAEPAAAPPLDLSPPQRPQPAAQAAPSLFGSIAGGIAEHPLTLMALGAGIMEGGFGKGLQAAVPVMNEERKQRLVNMTEQILARRGLSPEMAKIVANNPSVLQAVLAEDLNLKTKTDDIKEFEFAKQQGFTGSFPDWMARKRGTTGEYGLQPIWGTDDQGNPVIVQLGKAGEAIQAKLPPGVRIGKDALKIDTGTGTLLLDPVTRQSIGLVPKQIAEKEAQEEIGKARGKASADLQRVIDAAQTTLKLIESIEKDPYRQWGTGISAATNYIPGTPMWDFRQRVEQLRGHTFLEAYNILRGGGQITEREGEKAEQAIARLSTFQTEKGFLQALRDLKEVLEIGVARAYKSAGKQPPQQASAAGAATQNIPPPPPGFEVVR